MPDRSEHSGLPRIEVGGGASEQDLLATLRELQYVLLRHPVAAQAAFSALVAEGRRYGQTPEGRELRARLEGSDLIRRGRVVWEVATLKMLEEQPTTTLPTAFLDALVRASATPELEPLLTRLFEMGNEDAAADTPDAN